MRFNIIAVGKNTNDFIEQQIQQYCKRIISPLEIKALKTIKKSSIEEQRLYEAELIKAKLVAGQVIIVLDMHGMNLSSDELAQKLDQFQMQAKHDITFIIGGAEGLHASIIAMADLRLSFGRVTWPHMLMRVLILEQIYRCQQILSGHPYHR